MRPSRLAAMASLSLVPAIAAARGVGAHGAGKTLVVSRRWAAVVAALGAFLAGGVGPAQALPSFARQTGQPCAVCHTVFPELTPFGRRFKIGGYALQGGDWQGPPIAALYMAGGTHTNSPQDAPPAPGLRTNDNVVSQYFTNVAGSNMTYGGPLPTRAVRLRNGDTLISDQYNERVIQITPAPEQRTVFTQGRLDAPGAGFDRLNGPYDAKVVGDYTGLTPPFDFDAWDLPIPLR